MRWILGTAMAGLLLLSASSSASAQDLNGFGSYPAGITSGSAYGFYPGGYGPAYVPGRTASGYTTAPGVVYYSSRYYGGTAGATTYGPGINYSSPNAAAYGYGPAATVTAPYAYTPGYRYSTYRVRRGLFGPRAVRVTNY